MIDASPLRRLADGVIQQLEQSDTEGFVRTVALLVEIDLGDSTTLVVRCSDDRDWARFAFIDHVLDRMEEVRDAQNATEPEES